MLESVAAFQWHPIDAWMTIIAALAGSACALVGTLLLLRRMSMMADALSHAVLPGIVVAYLIGGGRGSLVMAAGAAVAAIVAVLLVQWLTAVMRVDRGAAMGAVLTSLFAAGLLLIVRFADRVDLDPSCVLYGSLETAAFRRIDLFGVAIPPAVLGLSAALALNLVVVGVLLKEFRLAIFDPDCADVMGIGSGRLHTILMILVAITVVASFEAVGSILPVAMIAAPAAAASLLTRRLIPMIAVAILLACVAAPVGHVGAIVVPALFGAEETVTSGSVATVGLLIFIAVWLARLALRGRPTSA